MKIQRSYIPSSDDALVAWLTNFRVKLTTHGATVGLIPSDVATAQQLCDEIMGAVRTSAQSYAEYQATVAAKDTTKARFLPTLRNTIARLKTHANYTAAIGEDLGVVGESTLLDPATYAPELTCSVQGGAVRVRITRGGADSVNLYSRPPGQVQWTFLSRVARVSYTDARPLAQAGAPEVREYMAMGVVGDTEFGQQSAIVRAVFAGQMAA